MMIVLSTINLDAPDPRELAAFYRNLLGYETVADEP
jgi:catechol-2,3-dioxygenase